MSKPHTPSGKICDYEGSTYRTDFWEGQGRDYEDRAERLALHRLLPSVGGQRLLELGAGFGRLTPEYHAYRQVVVLDYSVSHLREAQARLGRGPRYVYVAGDVNKLPFRPGVFDAATMIRVIHHIADAPAAMAGIRRTLAPGAVFVLEHANKRNLKAMLRYALGQQTWTPYAPEPYEFVALNFDHHPTTMLNAMRGANFATVRRLAVSYLRLGVLKRHVPTDLLMHAERYLQNSALFYSPSVFILGVATGETPDHVDTPMDDPDALFVAPETGGLLVRDDDTMLDAKSGKRWAVRDGIYDFKAPV